MSQIPNKKYIGHQNDTKIKKIEVDSNISFQIVDVETREPLGPNQEGEICINGPQITPGYYK